MCILAYAFNERDSKHIISDILLEEQAKPCSRQILPKICLYDNIIFNIYHIRNIMKFNSTSVNWKILKKNLTSGTLFTNNLNRVGKLNDSVSKNCSIENTDMFLCRNEKKHNQHSWQLLTDSFLLFTDENRGSFSVLSDPMLRIFCGKIILNSFSLTISDPRISLE